MTALGHQEDPLNVFFFELLEEISEAQHLAELRDFKCPAICAESRTEEHRWTGTFLKALVTFCILMEQRNWVWIQFSIFHYKKNREGLTENVRMKGNLVKKTTKWRVQSSKERKNSKIKTTKWTSINSENWQIRFHVKMIYKGKRS